MTKRRLNDVWRLPPPFIVSCLYFFVVLFSAFLDRRYGQKIPFCPPSAPVDDSYNPPEI
ncbi:hypothetical protein Krac_4424 [Ktedonobacter racemifer DSM 44963]|uniref:Uncharacterized protein n=1 Tax=Ktedonobacter racemifer DSM 44963 TaxID=485913 RepID=D6TSR0_KTERA|nr:hypothetical protein Krac_4424 [Ktedonobacter racemifer DSM 44963]